MQVYVCAQRLQASCSLASSLTFTETSWLVTMPDHRLLTQFALGLWLSPVFKGCLLRSSFSHFYLRGVAQMLLLPPIRTHQLCSVSGTCTTCKALALHGQIKLDFQTLDFLYFIFNKRLVTIPFVPTMFINIEDERS